MPPADLWGRGHKNALFKYILANVKSDYSLSFLQNDTHCKLGSEKGEAPRPPPPPPPLNLPLKKVDRSMVGLPISSEMLRRSFVRIFLPNFISSPAHLLPAPYPLPGPSYLVQTRRIINSVIHIAYMTSHICWYISHLMTLALIEVRPALTLTTNSWGAAVAEWLSSWLAEQEDRGSIPGLATWIFRDWLSPASKSRYGWKIAKSTLIL